MVASGARTCSRGAGPRRAPVILAVGSAGRMLSGLGSILSRRCAMRTQVLAVLAAGLLLGADPPDRGGAAGEVKKFTGTWQAVSIERDGRKAPAAEVEKVRLTVRGDHYTLTVGDQTIQGTHKLDPSTSPKHID